MEYNLLDESQVKSMFGVDDFRKIKKSQIIQFASSIPNMQKEVAIACINQFANFKEYSNIIVKHYYDLCDKVLASDPDDSIIAYRTIIDSMKALLDSGDTSEETKQLIIHDMIVVAEKLEIREDKKREYKGKVLQIAGAVGSLAITIAGALLGVRITKK